MNQKHMVVIFKEGNNMKKKYKLKVFPTGMGREVYRVIEISEQQELVVR